MYRQGDVLLIRRDGPFEVADGRIEPVARTNGRLVLAEGEATGHAHAITATGAHLLAHGSERLLAVDDSVELVHEEHAPITIPAGFYEVIIQRQFDYSTQAARRVRD